MSNRSRRDWYRIRNSAASGPTRIDLYDEIGGGDVFTPGVSAAGFVAELAQVDGDLEVHINSPGGNVFEGLAIYNALAQRPGNVTTVVDGLAASAASFIAQAGKTRLVSPGSMTMIHDASGLTIGNAADHRTQASLLDKASDNIASIYGAHSRRPGPDWRQAMAETTWYTADEAVAAGLADKLAERPVSTSALATAASFDLSVFAAVPGWVRDALYKPDPYRRMPDETVQCPACHKYNDVDASYCDQCGTKLAGRDDVVVTGSPQDHADADSGGDDSPDLSWIDQLDLSAFKEALK